MQLFGVFLGCLRRLCQVKSFLKGQIRLCQETSLYARIPDAANKAITKHIIECVGEFAMFGEFSEVGNEFSDSFSFLLSA